MGKPTNNQGFTLIELLIVMTLLLLLMGTVMLSMQTISSHWHKRAAVQSKTLQMFKNTDLLASALHAIAPFQVAGLQGNTGFYFLGRVDGFTAVTESGIYNAGRQSVFRLLKEQQKNGTYALFYEEAPLNQYALVFERQQHNFNFRLLIAENLQSLEFMYYGWPDFDSYLAASSEITLAIKPVWLNAYDGMQTRLQPEKVRVRLNGQDWDIALSTERNRFLLRRGSQSHAS